MLERNNQAFDELDLFFKELEKLIQWEKNQNELIYNRILEKELLLKKLEVEQYGEYYS